MDFNKLVSSAASAYSKYQEKNNHSDQDGYGNNNSSFNTGGAHPSQYPSGGGYGNAPQGYSGQQGSSGGDGIDFSKLALMVSGFLGGSGSQHGSSSGGGSNDLFATALKMATGSGGFNQGNAGKQQMQSSYNSIFNSGGSSLSEQGHQAMGLAAAYMAYQKFQSGQGQGQGGQGQNQLVAMAMSEAKNLFGQHSSAGGSASEKQTLATAAQAAMKLFGSSSGGGH